MGCLKNQKKFLWWKYNGEHQWTPDLVKKFMDCSDHFIISFECAHCGSREIDNFVTWERALELGLTNEQLREVKTWYSKIKLAE